MEPIRSKRWSLAALTALSLAPLLGVAGAELPVAITLAATAFVAAAPVAWARCAGAPLFWRVGMASATALACGLAARVPWGALSAPAAAQIGGQGPLLLVRAVLLCVPLLVLSLVPRPRRRALALVLAATSLASLFLQPLVLVAALAAVVTLAHTRRSTKARADGKAPWALALCTSMVAFSLASRPAAPPAPTTPEALARFEIERDNPWRALPHARAWAQSEATPGEGALALAQVAARLGDTEAAQLMLTRIAAQTKSADVRATALERRDDLAGSAP